MKLVTSSQMQSLDKLAAEKYGVSSLELMERAGRGVAEAVQRHFLKKGLVIVVVGKGNNGGDGLVAARYLKEAGYDVAAYLTSSWTEFSKDARVNWDRLAGLGIDVHEISSESELKREAARFEKGLCIVDAVFGTGLSSEVIGKYRAVIEFINSVFRPVVAVDIPSGLSADTGEPLGAAIRARLTVTLGMAKVGLFTAGGSEYAREVEIVDIGIPKELTENLKTGYFLTTPDMFASYFGKRPKDSHKGDFGHLLVLGGSSGKIGAGLLASRAVLRSGGGLVTYALPKGAYVKFDIRSPEIMYEAVKDGMSGRFSKESSADTAGLLANKKAAALGPGIGTENETAAFVLDVIKKCRLPLVIDADGINCLAGGLNTFKNRKWPVVITPHPGEMARLTGLSVKEIQSERIAVARDFARSNHLYVALKGYRTVIAFPDGDIYINPTGGPAMATAGMGDVLTGVILGLIGQNIPVDKAVVAGVYIHGLAGDLAAREIGERGLIASDVINCLPKAINFICHREPSTQRLSVRRGDPVG